MVLSNFQKHCQSACEVAKTAARNSKSLGGQNFYGNKFHDVVVAISQAETKLNKAIAACHLEASTMAEFTAHVSTLKSTSAKPTHRANALKQVRLICQSLMLPRLESMTANPVPQTEQVLPLAVVQGTRGYLEHLITQANGSYEHGWYDACSVMIRKFVEILIIEVYEAKEKADEIKDAKGNFLMLRDLISKILADTSWSLARDSMKSLPEIKMLGDRSAHNRRYLAKRQDVDHIILGLRVVADDLLHLAGLK